MKNLLLVAYRFPPAGGPAVQRAAKFARYLPEFGYRPLVLAGVPDSRKYSLDTTLLAELTGTTIVRCPGHERFWRLLRSTGLAALAKLFLVPDKEKLWLPAATRAALEIAKRHPIDAIFTTVAPRSCAILGRRLKKLLGVPWVLDYRDPWTTGARIWTTPMHRTLEIRQERQAVEDADAVVVVTPTMKDLLIEAFPEAKGKVHVICNGFDAADFSGLVSISSADKFRIAYTGGLADYHPFWDRLRTAVAKRLFGSGIRDWSTHSPHYLLHAVRSLLDEHPEWNERIELAFAGKFGKTNAREVRRLGLEHVVSLKGYLPHSQSVQLLMDSDVLFLTLFSLVNWPRNYVLTGKIFEYLTTGRPILAAVPEGDAREMIGRARAGWCVDPYDVQAMKTLLADLIRRKLDGRLALSPDRQYIGQFERRELTRRLAELFDGLCQSGADDANVRAA
ncbi:MAG: glycosyltransferase family 4 protein [Rhodopirellula sp.]|nr:glycosyltransferase family 4 protein [Rhodopirellula sp.]